MWILDPYTGFCMCRCGDTFDSVCYCERWLARPGLASGVRSRYVLHWDSAASVLGL
jgi:hypothetical protein